MQHKEVDDVIALSLPVGYDPTMEGLINDLNRLAVEKTITQYDGPGPGAIMIQGIEWMFTQEPDAIDRFQPAGHCASCQAGNDQLRAYLKEFPDGWLALGNIRYVEVWLELGDEEDDIP